MTPIHHITFIIAGFILALWTLLEFKGRKNTFLQRASIVLILIHIVCSLVDSETAFSFQSVTIDIGLLAFIGAFASLLKLSSLSRARSIFSVFALILIALVVKTSIIQTKAIKTEFIDDDYSEFLIEIPSDELMNFKKTYKDQIVSLVKAFDSKSIKNTELDEYYLLNIKNEKLEQFEKNMSDIRYCDWIEYNDQVQVEPNTQTSTTLLRNTLFNDPLSNEQWSLAKINISGFAKELIKKSRLKKARLFILDTGVDGSHEDLRTNFHPIEGEKNIDMVGHGTHCAGIAGAVTNNGIGVSSPLLDNRFYDISSIQVLNNQGYGTQAKIIQGMIKAVDNEADVISMSLGSYSNDSRQRAYNQAVDYANQNGTIVVVAAGNANMDARRFAPANAKGVICVGAIDQNETPASFSNSISDIEMGIYAPGVNILSTYPNNQYKSFNGTSMATPYVAALVSTLKSIKPKLSTEGAFQIINQNSSPLSEQTYSSGCVDFGEALKSLK